MALTVVTLCGLGNVLTPVPSLTKAWGSKTSWSCQMEVGLPITRRGGLAEQVPWHVHPGLHTGHWGLGPALPLAGVLRPPGTAAPHVSTFST